MRDDEAAVEPAGVAPSDEGPHAPGASRWAEVWWFAGTDGNGATVLTTYGVVPAERRAWYVAALVRPGESLLFVADDEIGRADSTLTVRRPNLWADHVCEAPFEQWTVANEAHAVALDDPRDVLGDGRGAPAAMAFDLEWYAAAPPRPLGTGLTSATGCAGYVQRGEVDGVVELAGGPITVVGAACRVHAWGDLAVLDVVCGADDPPSPSPSPPDRAELALEVRWPLPGGGAVAEQTLRRGAWRLALRRGAS